MTDIQKKYNYIFKSIEKFASIDETAFLKSQKELLKISIKINTNKIQNFHQLDVEISQKVIWANDACFLKSRPAFYADPLFYAGAYYVMDSSSMFLEYILKNIQLPANATVLDIAAAPGGKSVLISNYLDETGVLFSNEINTNRANVLNYNLSKWGKSNFIVTNHDSNAFKNLYNTFDLVVCDAPCTGTGLFRKYPEWIHAFNEHLIQQCVVRQRQILQNIFHVIKENGFLIYSTCSFLSEENEEMAKFIIENGFELVDISIPDNSGILKTQLGIRFFPHLTFAEGFFYAIFQKKKEQSKTFQSDNSFTKKMDIPEVISHPTHVPFSKFIDFKNFHLIFKYHNKFYLSNSGLKNIIRNLNLKYISIGTLIHHHPHQPAAELALSIHLNKDIPNIDLNYADALKFLRKDQLKIQANKNIYLISYKGLNLGWAKILENRINNYFPSEWRILKDID